MRCDRANGIHGFHVVGPFSPAPTTEIRCVGRCGPNLSNLREKPGFPDLWQLSDLHCLIYGQQRVKKPTPALSRFDECRRSSLGSRAALPARQRWRWPPDRGKFRRASSRFARTLRNIDVGRVGGQRSKHRREEENAHVIYLSEPWPQRPLVLAFVASPAFAEQAELHAPTSPAPPKCRPTDSAGTGKVDATLDTDTKMLTWTITYDGLSGDGDRGALPRPGRRRRKCRPGRPDPR